MLAMRLVKESEPYFVVAEPFSYFDIDLPLFLAPPSYCAFDVLILISVQMFDILRHNLLKNLRRV
jgi:hypothetical protein